MGLGKPKTVTKTLDEIRAMSPGELEAFAAEIGNAACTEVRQAVEWSYPHGVLATEQQFAALARQERKLGTCQHALEKNERTIPTFIVGRNKHLACLKQALLIPRPEAYDRNTIAKDQERSRQIRETAIEIRECAEAYEQKFNREAE